jgi:hypothetical protein
MPLLLFQDTPNATVVHSGPSTPTVTSLRYGIQLAHALGLHVFVTTLIQVNGPQSWAGAIQFSTYAQEQQWFESYWQAIKPYAQAAEEVGAEQFALGTEEEWLQTNAPDGLWNGLLENMQSVFSGQLTYDMSWTSLHNDPPAWMRNQALRIGVSAYLPQSNVQQRFSKQQISNMWQTSALPELDTFAENLGAPIFISEMGYRNSADTVYRTWESSSNTPADPEEQAIAYDAAFKNIAADQHILGCFLWGWDDAGAFNLKGTQAVQTIHNYYHSWQV